MHTVTPATGSNVSATDPVVPAARALARPSFSPRRSISPELHPLSVAAVDMCCRCFAVRLAGMDSYSPRVCAPSRLVRCGYHVQGSGGSEGKNV